MLPSQNRYMNFIWNGSRAAERNFDAFLFQKKFSCQIDWFKDWLLEFDEKTKMRTTGNGSDRNSRFKNQQIFCQITTPKIGRHELSQRLMQDTDQFTSAIPSRKKSSSFLIASLGSRNLSISNKVVILWKLRKFRYV